MSQDDLTRLLREWPFEPGRISARLIPGADGLGKLQIRLNLGLLQMEVDGRPDGLTPEGVESLLHAQRDRLEKYQKQMGATHGFVLSREECRALREEAVQYYHRYVGLFALGEFDRVIRDTSRNLDVFDLCHDHGADEGDRAVLEQFRPSVISMRSRAEAELAVREKLPKKALAALDSGLDQLREFFDDAGSPDAFEHSSEAQLLRGMRDTLVPKLPMSQRVELQERLQDALDQENYELAAILRDELRILGN